MNRIQSKDQNIGTYRNNEIFLSCYDDKNTYVKFDIVGYLISQIYLLIVQKIIFPYIDDLF